ncbi:MAG: hypothetical protein JSW27_21175 [Phycisphaerales bacterium]|nr:MAG: hypothetical protein JSW27_21175 [Phycisphaerales bacterium]
MGNVVLKNPNEPEQPIGGVYRWFFVRTREDGTSQEETFYVGRAGPRRHETVARPSTLGRGISELRRASGLSSDKGRSLDTDFIVGTMIMYLRDEGFDCVWEHVCNDPGQEKNFCNDYRPILQDENGKIRPEFKRHKGNVSPWNGKESGHRTKAKDELYGVFKSQPGPAGG